jgi:hypothetical protein
MELDMDFMLSHDRDSIAAELRRIAALTGKNTVSMREIDRFGLLSSRSVATKFGSLRQALEAAGLDASRLRRFTDDELSRMLADLWRTTLKESGRSPLLSDVRKYGLPVSSRMISDRFGSWKKALVAAREVSQGRTPSPTAGRRRHPISPHTRFLVFKRDLYTCRICRRAGVELVLDHVIPVSQGGSDAMENLQALCVPCNQGKGGNLQ